MTNGEEKVQLFPSGVVRTRSPELRWTVLNAVADDRTLGKGNYSVIRMV